MQPIDSVRLRVTALSGKAIDYLRFMTGREVRGRVVRGGGAEDVLHIRIGAHLLKARLNGSPLPTGRDFYMRVEAGKDGSFRLVVLSGLETGTAGGRGAIGGASAAPTLSPVLIRNYLAFLQAAAPAVNPGRKQSGSSPGQADLGRLNAGAQKDFIRKVFQDLGEGQKPPGLQFMGEPVEFLLLDEWKQPETRQKDAENAPGSQNNSGKESDHSDSESETEGEALGWGRGEPEPACFCLRLRLPRLGTIGVLITAPDRQFEAPSIHVTPLRPAVLRLIEPRLADWRTILGERIPGLAHLMVLPPDPPAPAGGVDFSA